MQLFSIRGSAAYAAIVIAFTVALAAGAPGLLAIVMGLFAGPTASWIVLRWGPFSRAADRADDYLETPRPPTHPE